MRPGTEPGVVEATYLDASGGERRVADEVLAAVREALGEAPEGADPVAVARPGRRLAAAGSVTLEDGTALGRRTAMPPDAPFGYHCLERDDGTAQLLITGPGSCHLPHGLRDWGWAVQLAAARSELSWGIGDLRDLRDLAAWSSSLGAAFLAVSPLGAPNPGPAPEPSPYSPSTRRFGNPLHIRVEEVPGGAAALGPHLADLAGAARQLNADRRIDRGRVLALKMAALERVWASGTDREGFARWRGQQAPALERWCAFSVLAERFGSDWRAWSPAYRDPGGAAWGELAGAERDRVGFHAWLQWCFEVQLAAASAPLRRIGDMPVGVDPGGFDAWEWQAQLAGAASIGAPPDAFNTAGQDWGLPPFIPHRLRQAGYDPLIETLRAQLRHAGGLRIDHVLGLFRLWWIPFGSEAARGAYVRYPAQELLEIVALESHRAGAVVIGEDLGTVPPGVREELRRRNVLSTRLALFETSPPTRWPRKALAAVTTHDLPTIAGAWTGADLRDQQGAGLPPDAEGLSLVRRRLAAAAGVAAGADLEEAAVALHRRLARSPAALVAATLEDALRVVERPNMPGTVAPARDNWSLALPAPLERLFEDPAVLALAEALRR